MKDNRGYILIYAVMVISVMLIITTSVSKSALNEFFTSRDILESAKAYNVAESAVECLLAHDLDYIDEGYYPFDTMSPPSNVTCWYLDAAGTPQTRQISVGNIDGDPSPFNCKDEDYTPTPLTLGVGSDPCSKTTVAVTATLVPGFASVQCDVRIIAEGYNDCSNASVQRVRWTHLVPKAFQPAP